MKVKLSFVYITICFNTSISFIYLSNFYKSDRSSRVSFVVHTRPSLFVEHGSDLVVMSSVVSGSLAIGGQSVTRLGVYRVRGEFATSWVRKLISKKHRVFVCI